MTGIGVVGAGHWGPHLIRNFNDHLSSQVLWVAERDERRKKGISERFPGTAVTADVDEILSDDRVDAVIVATPTSTHAAIVQDALEADKHVLVEKPIAYGLEDSIALCEMADSRGLTLMVGHVFLFNPAFRAARDYIHRGDLGLIRYLSMVRTNLGPVRTDVNAAWDLASHDVSIANYWLDALPKSVSARGGSWLNEGIDDVVFATLSYPDDVLVHIEASWLNPRKRRLVAAIGSDRMLTVDDMDLNEPIRLYDKGVLERPKEDFSDTFAGFRNQIREGEVRIPHVTGGEPLRTECDEFLRRIAGSDDTLSDGWEGARVVAVLDAIDRSIVEGGASIVVEKIR
ncbi:MAG: Gfo/Idh/MocA family protein [Actinomycetota bacterium]